MEDIEAAIGFQFHDENYETFTGLVFNTLSMIPNDGVQDMDLRIPPMKVHISRIENHQIAEATIRMIQEAETQME